MSNSSKKDVFLITEFYHSQQNTTGYLIEKLYKKLSEQFDINLTLIAKLDAGCPTYSEAVFVKAKKPPKKNLISRFIYELMISIKFMFVSWKIVHKNSLVFTGTTPIFLLIVIAVLKKIIGFKWLLLVHDVFPENLIAAGIINRKNYFYKILKKFFDNIYSQANHTIVIGEDMKMLIRTKTGKDNISIVQNWIDTDDILIEDRVDNKILKELDWNNDSSTIFQFFGNIGRVQGIDILLQAISRMKHKNKAKFLFIGNGAYVDDLKNKIYKSDFDNIVYYGAIDQQDKSIGLNACDVALVTLADGMLGLGVPSKAYYSMAANKPLFAVVDEKSEISNMVDTHGIGWIANPSCIDDIAEKLDLIVMLDHNYPFINSPREILKMYYSEAIAMEKIVNIIKAMV